MVFFKAVRFFPTACDLRSCLNTSAHIENKRPGAAQTRASGALARRRRPPYPIPSPPPVITKSQGSLSSRRRRAPCCRFIKLPAPELRGSFSFCFDPRFGERIPDRGQVTADPAQCVQHIQKVFLCGGQTRLFSRRHRHEHLLDKPINRIDEGKPDQRDQHIEAGCGSWRPPARGRVSRSLSGDRPFTPPGSGEPVPIGHFQKRVHLRFLPGRIPAQFLRQQARNLRGGFHTRLRVENERPGPP